MDTMAASTADSVTIDRASFGALLRRANFNQQDGFVDAVVGASGPIVPVPKGEYDQLRLMARQYANLRQNLINGGVTEETISLLSQDDASAPQAGAYSTTTSSYKHEETEHGGARLNPTFDKSRFSSRPSSNAPYKPYTTNGHGNGTYHGNGFGSRQTYRHHDWSDPDPTDGDVSPTYSADGPTPDINHERTFGSTQRPHYARMCRRTISLCGLPDHATHWDITSAVRGGLLLDIFVRASEHVALVSFLREEDAVRFYEHGKKNDIYIQNKRIFVRWSDRHFHLAGHVAGKIAIGATRNIVVRRCDPKHTEDSVRDDLEHIHNLVVVKVDFIGGSCYIKTNSVHNAMFARTCMMSRAKYKGSKIEWDVDECDQPIDIIQKTPPKPQQPLPVKKPMGMRNRFATLRLDDDDDEIDDKFDTSSELPSTVDVIA